MNKQEIEKAIQAIDDFNSHKIGEYSLAAHFKVIKEALISQLNNGWIPVSSGILPEDRDYPPVNCCNIEDKWSDSAIVNDHGQFINSEECQIYPTHWKPLPSWEEVSDAERN